MKKIFSIFLIILMLSFNISLPVQAAKKEEIKEATQKDYSVKVLDAYSYKIPGLDTNWVPQGLCKLSYRNKEKNIEIKYRLITAYNKNKNARIYMIDSNGQHVNTVEIKNTAGKHVGGITQYQGAIFIASTNRIYRIELVDIATAAIDKKKPRLVDAIELSGKSIQGGTPGNLSFCTTKTYLWVGTYDKNQAKAYGYTYDKNTKTLKLCATMKGIPVKSQGMAFYNKGNKVYFSTSAGKIYSYPYSVKFNNTKRIYEYILMGPPETIKVPTYAQGIYFTDKGNLYVSFESGSKLIDSKTVREKRVVLLDL